MEILVVLRNLYGNPDPFEDEKLLCDSDINALTEACDLRDNCSLANTSTPQDAHAPQVARTPQDVHAPQVASTTQDAHAPQVACTPQGNVTALLISESKADYETVLKKAASYGADQVIHAPVDSFDFSDANRFARLIGSLIKSMSPLPDLVLFGRLAYDGDSVNIATQVAENLGWHRAIYSSEVISVSYSESSATHDDGNATLDHLSNTTSADIPRPILTYKKALDEGALATVEVPLPAVLHTVRRGGLRRQAKISDIIRAYSETVVATFDETLVNSAVDEAKSGSGLPTPTSEIPPYSNKEDMILLNGVSDVDTAQNIIDVLKNLGFEAKR